MARDVVAITALTLNSSVAAAAGTSVVVANGAYIAASGDTSGLFIEVINTTTGEGAVDKDVIFRAGDNPPAFRSGPGDLTVEITSDTTRIFTLESARFAQDNGDINIDFETGFEGTVKAYRLPAGVVV